MRTRNELDRLSEAAPPLLARTEILVDAGEETRILARILESDRPAPVGHRPRRAALTLVGIAVLAAAGALAAIAIGGGNTPSTQPKRHHLALTGQTIELAGYKFRTPAGFKHSAAACTFAPDVGTSSTIVPTFDNERPPPPDGFAAAGSADGGCVQALYLAGAAPSDAAPVDVGSYQGYYASQGSEKSALYVDLPHGAGAHRPVYLVLWARGLTEEQLIAVAESGLPGSP